jgi:hypothetical protein
MGMVHSMQKRGQMPLESGYQRDLWLKTAEIVDTIKLYLIQSQLIGGKNIDTNTFI